MKRVLHRVFNLSGLNLKVQPLLLQDGQCLQCVNYDPLYIGAKTKRQGYVAFLDQIDSDEVKSLIYHHKADGTKFLLRVSGKKIYKWAFSGDTWGTAVKSNLTTGLRMGHVSYDDTLCLGNGTDNSMHTTDGSSFTDTSGAPKAKYWTQWKRRIYAAGNTTAPSTLFWSSAGSATNWSGSPPSDSSSLTIPGPGKIDGVFTANNTVVISKDSGLVFHWDGTNLTQVSESLAPTSYESIAPVERSAFYLNRLGVYDYTTGLPRLLSNAIESYIYNSAGNGVAGSAFNTAPGVTYRYKYLVAVGDITGCFGNSISNGILVYDFQLNEWGVYSFAHLPTAWVTYLDANSNETLCFGDASGKTYTYGSGNDDAGAAIETKLEIFSTLDTPESNKTFRKFWVFTNPGCGASVKVYLTDSFTKERKDPISVGDVKEGVADKDFPTRDALKKYLFVKVTERSKGEPHTFYGYSVQADVEEIR